MTNKDRIEYGKAKDKVEDFADDVSRKVNDFFDKKDDDKPRH